MFDLSIEKLFVLLMAALFVLGPERLPAAAAWLGATIRKIKSFAGDTEQRLRDELGPEYDELKELLAQLRAPLQELRSLSRPGFLLRQDWLEPSNANTPALSRPTGPPLVGPSSSARTPPFDTDAT